MIHLCKWIVLFQGTLTAYYVLQMIESCPITPKLDVRQLQTYNNPIIFIISDGKHCVDQATEDLHKAKGLNIQAWVTYSYEDDYTQKIAACEKFDKRYQIGKKVYYRLVLWLEDYK